MEVSPQVQVEKGSNLIVNYIPNDLSDEDFHDLFSKVGPIFSAKVMRNKATGYSFGYGFVNYLKAEDAQRAINELNGHAIQNKRLKVAPCRRGEGNDEIKNANLYVANLPKTVTEEELRALFEIHGEIIRTKILVDQGTNESRGCGFILFSKTAEADAAIKAFHGQMLEGATSALTVKRAKEDQKNQQQQMGIMGGHPQQSVHIIHHYAPFAEGGAAGAASAPLSALGGGQNGGPMRNVISKPQRYNPMQPPSNFHQGYGPTGAPPMTVGADGSMGHTIFVYNIGNEASEIDLYTLFGPFGAIVKVHIQRDMSTGVGKGFGFVTFGDYNDASLAIQAMNGYPYEKNNFKPLQVSFKTSKNK